MQVVSNTHKRVLPFWWGNALGPPPFFHERISQQCSHRSGCVSGSGWVSQCEYLGWRVGVNSAKLSSFGSHTWSSRALSASLCLRCGWWAARKSGLIKTRSPSFGATQIRSVNAAKVIRCAHSVSDSQRNGATLYNSYL